MRKIHSLPRLLTVVLLILGVTTPFHTVDARGPFPLRELTINGTTTPLGNEGLTPFEIDAQDCDGTTGGTDYNCTIDQEGAFDFIPVTVPPQPPTSGTGYPAGQHSNINIIYDIPYSGILLSNTYFSDGGLIGCTAPVDIIVAGANAGESNTFDPPTDPSNPAQNTNPWPVALGDSGQKKTDACIVWQAAERVRVFESDGSGNTIYDQYEDILYTGLEINSQATGDKSAVIPLFYPFTKTRTGGEYALDVDINPNGTTILTAVQWVPDSPGSIGGSWQPTTVGTTDSVDCVKRGDEKYAECAFNLTLLGAVPDDLCVEQKIPGLITRTGNSANATLQDQVEMPNPITFTNCGNINITKETNPVIDPTDPTQQTQFLYSMFQRDLKAAYDDTTVAVPDDPDPINGTGVVGTFQTSNRTTTGSCTAGGFACNRIMGDFLMPKSLNLDTDDWTNVIAQPDYFILESSPAYYSGPTVDSVPNWPIDEAHNPKSIVCEWTDVFSPLFADSSPGSQPTSGPIEIVTDGSPRPDGTISDPADLLLANIFEIPNSPFFGKLVDPTVCTITNTSVTTPITLSAFHAYVADGGIKFDWTTQTEVGNIGFYLYQQDAQGNWERLGDMVPNQVGETATARNYSQVMSDASGTIFAISDVDIRGRTKMHGPFNIDEQYGESASTSNESLSNAIDWKKVRAEHETKKKARQQKNKQNLQRRMKKAKPEKVKPNNSSATESVWGRMLDGVLSLIASPAYAAPKTASVQTAPVSAPVPAPSPESIATDPGLMRILVNETGLYRVTYEQLLEAGLDLAGENPAEIALTNAGSPVQIHVHAVASTTTTTKGKPAKNVELTFGPGGYIEFVGQALDTLYTDINVYILYKDEAKAARVTDVSEKVRGDAVAYYMETVRVEPQNTYDVSSTGDDPWYAHGLRVSGSPMTLELEINTDHYANGAAPVTVAAGMWGVTDFPGNVDDHHVVLTLNTSAVVAEESFDGHVGRVISGETDALQDGVNTLKFTMPWVAGQNPSLVNLDYWSVTYPRQFVAGADGNLVFDAFGGVFAIATVSSGDNAVVYRVQSNGTTERLTNLKYDDTGIRFAGQDQLATYYVSSSQGVLTAALEAAPEFDDITSGEAAYLVVSHPDFIGTSAMNMLTGLHSDLSPRVVDVEQIYAQFGHGVFGPHAIKEYISYAAQNMQTTMVYLVGGDNYDYRNFKYLDAVNFIPSLYAVTGPIVRFAPVDPLFVDVDNDGVPDLGLGRTPATTEAEFEASVSKLEEYESIGYPETSVFVADRTHPLENYDFTLDADSMIAQMSENWSGVDNSKPLKAYVDVLGAADAKTVLTTAINGGVALTSFVGHSSKSYWGDWQNKFFTTTDVDALLNDGKPTVVTQWGCWNTYYVNPVASTLMHKLMLNDSKGAVAVIGASTRTSAIHESLLAKEFYARLFEPGKPIGLAIMEAKKAYVEKYGAAADVILGWQYMGDPALIMQK